MPAESIDLESGVIRGVRVVENGKMANFTNGTGRAVSFRVSEDWIEAFMSHVGNRALPVHWTHDYLDSNGDRLNAKVGAMKNFRVGENRNLVADLHVAPTDKKELIFWSAQNDKEGMMMSAVFTYGAHDPDCTPLSADAVDIVSQGAATTALLSKTLNTDTDMTKEETDALVAQRVKDALANPETVKAILAMSAPSQADKETAALAALEKESGVTDEDKRDTDANLPAAMASQARIQRATARKSKLSEDALLVRAKAEVLGTIGTGAFSLSSNQVAMSDVMAWDASVKAHIAAMPEGKKDRGVAVLRARNDNPKLYNAIRETGRAA